NRDVALQVLKTKVSSGKRDVFSDAIAAAAREIQDRPEGSRHVVLITDGVDTAGVKAERAKALKQLIAARATVHILSYTEFVRKTNDQMVSEANAVARDIGAEYVITYRPKRPLAAAEPGEYRRIQVTSRRVGLSLRSRRGYVVSPAQ